MILKFWSNIGLTLQIVLVVAGVLAFSFFDPFGILNTKKQTLVDTPISVKSVREIGEFISAEYYGEVLTSLQEARLKEVEEKYVSEEEELKSIQEQFQYAIYDLRDRKDIKLGLFGRGRKLSDLFYKLYPELTEHPYYQSFIEKVLEENNVKSERKLLKELYKEKEEKIEGKLKGLELTAQQFIEARRKASQVLTANRKFRKSQIVVLGRGWVKAGINFGKFSEQNFKYDKVHKTIHLVGLRPEILVSTINPWFIPEKQIKGFEVVMITKKARKPKYMQLVKQRSLEKLRQKALQAGILEQAKRNAEENLKNFFSLLIPEGIDKVIIHDGFLSYFDASFLSDSLTAETLQSIDSLFMHRYQTDSAEVIGLRDSLKTKNLYLNDKTYPIGRYSSYLIGIADQVLSEADKKWFEHEKNALRQSIEDLNDSTKTLAEIAPLPDRLDSVWFFPNKNLVELYKREVKDLMPEKFRWYQVVSDDDDYLNYKKQKRELLKRKIFTYINTGKLNAIESLISIYRDQATQYTKGDTTFVVGDGNENVKEIITKDSLKVIYVKDLNKHLKLSGAGMYNEDFVSAEKDTLSLNDLNGFVRVLEDKWRFDRKTATAKKDSLVKYKELLVNGRLIPIERYYRQNVYFSNDTIRNEWVEFLENELRDINYRDSIIMRDFEEQDIAVLDGINQPIDRLWFYPTDSVFKTYLDATKRRNYGLFTSSSQKRALKKVYTAFQIEFNVLADRKSALKLSVNDLVKRAKVLETKNGYVTKQEGRFHTSEDLDKLLLTIDGFTTVEKK